MRLGSFLLGFIFSFCFSFAAMAQQSDLLEDLKEAGLSARAYQLMQQKIQGTHYKKETVAIADFTLPSSQPRFFLINLKSKTFKTFQVSHGIKSGGSETISFSNELDSNQSSLGFMKTTVHKGMWNPSLGLIGLSPSNSNLQKRNIILHGAEYSSTAFEKQNGFWGRSLGCLTLPRENIDTAIQSLGTDALILSYHDKLWDQAQITPGHQELSDTDEIPPATDWEKEENALGNQRFEAIKSRYISGDRNPSSKTKAIHREN